MLSSVIMTEFPGCMEGMPKPQSQQQKVRKSSLDYLSKWTIFLQLELMVKNSNNSCHGCWSPVIRFKGISTTYWLYGLEQVSGAAWLQDPHL